jgi:putative transposase
MYGSYYRRHLPHYQNDFRTYFITFATLKRRILPPEVRDLVLRHIRHEHERRIFINIAVVMPDHVHIIGAPLWDTHGRTYAIWQITKGIKGSSARSVNRLLGSTGPLWQGESFDHQLRREESVMEKMEYVANNPVRAALVMVGEDYPWVWRGPG